MLVAPPGPALADRFAEAFTRAQRQPVRIYRLMHDVLHCQMGLHVTLADAAHDRWLHDQHGIPTTIVADWLDLRPETFPPDPPPKSKRRRRKLTLVRPRSPPWQKECPMPPG